MIDQRHLTEEQIAICADALNQSRYLRVKGVLRDHVAYCNRCAIEVLFVVQMFSESSEKQERKMYRINPGFIALLSAIAALLVMAFVVGKIIFNK